MIMKIENLLSLKKWTPLSKVVNKCSAENYIGKSLYRIDENLYLSLTQFRLDGVEDGSVGPYVVGIICAPDDGAAKRTTMLAIEDDAGRNCDCPIELLPPNSQPAYGEILQGLRRMRPKVCQEAASYRIASDGKFVHRTIETERFTYYFRSANDDPSESPYAILYKL